MADQYLGTVVWFGTWNPNLSYTYIPSAETSWVSYNNNTYLTINIPTDGTPPDQDSAWVKVSVINGGGGGINSIRSGTCIAIDNTDPANPIVNIANSGVLPALDGNQLINLNKSQIGLSNVQNVDQTNADNLLSGAVNKSLLPIATNTDVGVANYPIGSGLIVNTGNVNVNVDNSTIKIVNNQLVATSLGGGVQTVRSGTGINVDNSDPANPIVNVANAVTLQGNVFNGTNQLTQTDSQGNLNGLVGYLTNVQNGIYSALQYQGLSTTNNRYVLNTSTNVDLTNHIYTATMNYLAPTEASLAYKNIGLVFNLNAGLSIWTIDKNNVNTTNVIKNMAFQNNDTVNIIGGSITDLSLLSVKGVGQNNAFNSDGITTRYTYGVTPYTSKLINHADLGYLILDYETTAKNTAWSKLNMTLDLNRGFQFQYTNQAGAVTQYTLSNMAFQDSANVSITGGNAALTTLSATNATIANLTLTKGTITTSPVNGTDIANKAYVDSKLPTPSSSNSVVIPVLNLGGINGSQSAVNYATRIPLGIGANFGPIPSVNVPTNGIGSAPIGIFGVFSNPTNVRKYYNIQFTLTCFCTNSTGSGDTTSIIIGSRSITPSFNVWSMAMNNPAFTQTKTSLTDLTTFVVNNKGVTTITVSIPGITADIPALTSYYVGVEMNAWFPANNSNTYSLINNVTLTLIDQNPTTGLQPIYLDNDYTVQLEDFNNIQYFIVVAPNITITLPLIESVVAGQKIYVKNNTGIFNTTFVTSSPTDLIDSGTSYQLNIPLQAVEIWQAVGNYSVF